MWTVLAFLTGLFIGVLMSALVMAADDENEMIYKEGYCDGYSDGKKKVGNKYDNFRDKA